ncbi:MAG TPA: hypothetical protein VHB25_13495 [Gemmatimonadaceae bacterium]|nr:hypothetical protein [Gemmatimonadaceae bacterium]
MLRTTTRERCGFAYIWVLVTVAILAALIAVAAPYLYTSPDPRRMAVTATELRSIGVGVNAFEAAINRKFPGFISELDVQLATTNRNSCGQTFAGPDVTAWNTNAPFLATYFPNTGDWTPIGMIRDSIPNRNANRSDSIWIELPGVSAEDARLLDITIDGRADSTRDTVRFHTPVNDTTTVRFRVTPRELNRC